MFWRENLADGSDVRAGDRSHQGTPGLRARVGGRGARLCTEPSKLEEEPVKA